MLQSHMTSTYSLHFSKRKAEMNKIDFSYAFAPPHRIVLSRPVSSRKTIMDVMPEGLVSNIPTIPAKIRIL